MGAPKYCILAHDKLTFDVKCTLYVPVLGYQYRFGNKLPKINLNLFPNMKLSSKASLLSSVMS